MKFGESDRASRLPVSPLRVRWIFLVSGNATYQELADVLVRITGPFRNQPCAR